MKRFFTTLLVSILIVLPLTGCAEEVIPPTGNGDFGITIDQLIQGLEEDRLSRVETVSYTHLSPGSGRPA